MNQQVTFTNNIAETQVDIDTAVPLGLIMNELMTNSFKYAFNKNAVGEMIIGLEEIGEHEFMLVYKDNGSGLPEDFDVDNAPSLGMRLIHRLAYQLSGKVLFEQDNNFAVFKVQFKNTEGRNLEA